MITGVVAQEQKQLPRGSIPFRTFIDDDRILGPVILTGTDRLLLASNVVDTEQVFTGNVPMVLAPPFGVGFVDRLEEIFKPSIARDQLLVPVAVFVDGDQFERPDIRIPGFLQPSLVATDDVIFATPLILDRGMLRSEMFFDVETIFNATIVTAQTLGSVTLLPNDDVLPAPLVRIGIGPSFVLADDFVFHMISTSFFTLALMVDDARPVTEVATMNGFNTGVTVSNSGLTATRNQYSSQFIQSFGVASAMTRSKGKFYFEATITANSKATHDSIGILQTVTQPSWNNVANQIYCSAVYINRDGIIASNNNAYRYFLGNCEVGDIIGCAIDLDNHRGWFRRNGGPWNGYLDDNVLPDPPPDPTTGAGAVIIALGDYAPMGCFAGSGPYGVPGDEYVFNFGASEYQAEMPASYDHWRLPSPFPASPTADRFGEAFLGIPTTLDAPFTGVDMSNGNLTATKNAGGVQPNVAVWSTATQNYGKFYFEVTVNAAHGVGDCVGISPSLNDQNLAIGPTVVSNTVLGQITANYEQPVGKNVGDNFEPGDVIRVAVDLTEQHLTYGGQVWFSLNGGPWNGDATADPVLRTGGVKNSGFNYRDNWSPVVGFGGSGSVNGDQMTANFGATPFAYPKPDAYAPWPNKILNVIQAVKPNVVADADSFLVATVDSSIKVLSVLDVVQAPDNIFAAASFGGNLAAQVNTVVDAGDTIYAPGFYGSLDGGLESTNVTVSNAGRTATLTTSLNNTGARSINFQTSGKFYFEITADAVHSANGAGLLLATGTYFNMINSGTNCLSVYANTGNIYSNGGSTGKSLGAVTNGTVLGFAIDLTARKGWVRKPTGSWNGDATADPVSGAGGVTIGAGYFAPAVGFGGGGQVAGDAWTANFGRSVFAIVPPTGFAAGWPGGAAMVLLAPLTVPDDVDIKSPAIANFTQGLTTGAALADDGTITPPKLTAGVTATLDGAATNATLSGGNLIATHNAAITDSGARSATQKSAGRFYFEVVVGQTTGANDIVGMTYGTYANMVAATPANTLGVRLSTGAIYGGNISSGFSVGACAPGDVLGFAIDFGLGRGWVSKNGGLWNGNATHNPVTGANGAVFTTGQLYVPAVGFGGTGTAIGDAATFRFGPAGVALVTGFGDWVVLAPTGLASFDGTPSNANVSNGNLTATHTNTTSNSGARSNSLKSTGKFYFEVAMTTTHGTFDCAGILTSSGLFVDLVANGTNCVTIYKNTGNIFASNTNSGKTLGAIAAGDVLGFAIDLTARKGWVRKNGGLWNGLAAGSENPATGLGGVTIAPTVTFAPAVGFGGTGTAAGDEMTANFGSTAFGTAAPAGFTNWTV